MSSDLGKKRVEHELFLRAFLSTKPPDRVAAELSRMTRDTHLDRGDVLFEAGQAPERLHFVAAGRVHLTAPNGATSVAEAGSLLGMLDASIPRPRMRTATALDPTHVLSLDFADYLDILEDNFGFAVDTLRSGAEGYWRLAERVGAAFVLEPADAPPTAPESGELDVVERILVLQHVGLFRGAPAQALVELAHLAQIQLWNPGDTVFSIGDSIAEARIVVRGQVAACHANEQVFAEFGPYQVVSDLAILGTRAHEFTARAKAATTTLDIHVEDLFDIAEDHFDLWRSMLSYVARQRARLIEETLAHAPAIDLGRMTL